MPEAPVTSATFDWAPFMLGGEGLVSLLIDLRQER